jgi:hypothetical protein
MTRRIVFRAWLVMLALRGSRWLFGMHPIGHRVQLAETALAFPRIADFIG